MWIPSPVYMLAFTIFGLAPNKWQKTLKERGIENMLDDARKVTKEADGDYNKR